MLIDLIDLIKFKTKLNQRQVAVRSGYKPTYLSEVLNRDEEPSDKIINKIRAEFKSELEEADSHKLPLVEEDLPEFKTQKTKNNGEGLTMQALVNLTESIGVLAESIKVKEDSFKIVAATHADLVTMVKQKDGFTVRDESRSTVEMQGLILAMRELLVQLTSKVNGIAPEVVGDTLDKMTTAAVGNLEQMGSVPVSDRQSRG